MVDFTPWLLPLLSFAITLTLTALAALLTGVLITRAMRLSSPQVAAGARRLGMAVVGAAGVILAVQELGVSPVVLLVILGFLGVASLLALREQLENLGAKYFTDVYVPFKAGDSIQIGPFAGKVIEINAMCTVLLSQNDQLLSIPNSMFMKEVVLNASPQAWKELVIPLSISGAVDLPAFESELLRSLSKLRYRLDRRFPPVVTTRARTPQSTDLSLTVMIRRPEEREALLLEVNKRISEVLEKGQAAHRVRPAAAPKASTEGP